MPIDIDDPDQAAIIAVSNAELERLESAAAKDLLIVYERERDILLERIAKVGTEDTFGSRHAQVILKVLDDALDRLRVGLDDIQRGGITRALELGAEASGREIVGLEEAFGSPARSRALASLTSVMSHRAVIEAGKLESMTAVYELANLETRNLVIEFDAGTRAIVQRGLIQGRSSRQMVPELRRQIGLATDSKAWQMERTLRTGMNAAVNRGHNAGYVEAKELLPDLQRRASETLDLARTSGGKRRNHPFSSKLHGKITSLDKPWIVPSGRLPVMFWPYDQARGAYVGMQYPAHVFERGRQVPYREAWERRKAAAGLAPR